MFGHMMGNDPRPHYFHQTNLMTQSTPGDALYYETLNPLLTEYAKYFAADAPIVQPTMSGIAAILGEQSAWSSAVSAHSVTGSIAHTPGAQPDTMSVTNTSSGAVQVPLTGTTVGDSYAGSTSGWAAVSPGTSQFTTLSAWPDAPLPPAIITYIKDPAPSTPAPGGKQSPNPSPPGPTSPSNPQANTCAQVGATKEQLQIGYEVPVSIKCQAAKGVTGVTGKLALTVSGQSVTGSFRLKPGKTGVVTLTLPKKARSSAAGSKHPKLSASLKISTNQSHGAARISAGKLTITTTPLYSASQSRPTSVHIKHGTVTVSLVCKASWGKTAKGRLCTGTVTLSIGGKKVKHGFRIRSGKTYQVALAMPKVVQAAAASTKNHRRLGGKLTVVSNVAKHQTYTPRAAKYTVLG